MKNIAFLLLFSVLSTSSFAWGTKKAAEQSSATANKKITPEPKTTSENKKPEQSQKKPTQTNDADKNTQEPTVDTTAPAETPLTDEERKFLIINKLKTSEPSALDIYSDGKTVEANIPIANYTFVYFDDIIDDVTYTDNSGLTVFPNEVGKPTKFLKIQSTLPTLKNLDVQVKLKGNKWHKITFRTSLKEKRYSKINIIDATSKLGNIDELKALYFKKDVQVKEVSKLENLKAIRLILDRITPDTKRHFAQLEIEEKVDRVIIDHTQSTGLLITLNSAVAEAYKIVGGIHEAKDDTAIEKEIILFNLSIENKNDSVFILTEDIIMKLFPNFIAFYYDKNNPTIPPGSKMKINIVVEDHQLDTQTKNNPKQD